MSNPLAVSVRDALTSYYELTSDWDDECGNNVSLQTVITTGGSISSGRMAANTRGNLPITSIPFGPNTGKITLGVLLYYSGGTSGEFTISLEGPPSSLALALGFTTSTGRGQVQGLGWATLSPPALYAISAAGNRKSYYPITVRAQDSIGQTAFSDQVIAIDRGLNPSVPFLAILTWDEGLMKMYFDTTLQGTLDVPATYNTALTRLAIGQPFGAQANTGCPMSHIFYMADHVMTQEEINYFYNYGTIKTFAQIEADAA